MANKYPTVKATAAKHGSGKGKPFSQKKIGDFLQSDGEPGAGSPKVGGFYHGPGTDQFLWKLPNINRAQALRLLVSRYLPDALKALKEMFEEQPYSDEAPPLHQELWPAQYWNVTMCPAPHNTPPPSRLRNTVENCGQVNSTTVPPGFVNDYKANPTNGGQLWGYYNEWGTPIPNALNYKRKRVGSLALKPGRTSAPWRRQQPTVVQVAPLPLPQAWPQSMPQPQPKAKPWAKAKVGTEPALETKPRPDPYPLVPLPVPAIQVDNIGQGKGQLDAVPVTQVWTGTGNGGVGIRPGPTGARAPGPKKKQQKINVVAVGGRVWVLLNMATEAIDFVDAMWKAIPKDDRRKCTTPQCKLRDLWDNMGAIDLSDAVENYLNMQLTDYLSALTGIPTKKLSQQLGHITGVDRAVNQVAGMWMDQGLKDLGIETHNISELFPKIDWDINSGIVSLSIDAIGAVDIDLSDMSFSVGTIRR